VRILTQDAVKCYTILGLIHLNFQPLSSRFKDYVAVPKENGYQTIHTTVFYSTAIFEVQIRTYEMHNTAELGVAAHWKYKSGGNGIKLDWLSNLQYQNESVEDFYELVKNDIYSKDISVFSPTGDPFTLPRGAVALDFAYAVHSEVGNKASSCLINKSKASLLSEVHNGDIVKINLSNDIITRCSWIDAVKTSRATTNMRLNCNNRIKEINIKSSINIVATAMSLNKSRVEEWFDTNHYDTRFTIAYDIESFRNVIYMYTQDISKNNRFKGFLSRHRFKLKSKIVSGLEVFSVSNITDVVFDYCCHTKAGDEIMAFLEKSKVHVHHKMCKSAAKMLDENQPMVFIRWEKEIIYQYNLIVSLHNEKGALAEFLAYLVKLDIDIGSIELGKRSSDYIKYCEIGFNSKEGNINSLRSKIENNIKVIHLIRKDDAYKK